MTVTGLFTSRGPRLLGWAHQTYAEFLAARFLYERGLSADDLTGVLTHSAEPTKVVPQLRETAAWLASMDPDVFRRIARDDPKILLRSDMALADDASRERIVASILQLIEAREMFDTDPFLRSGYEKLLHGGLAAQLEPYIGDRSKYFMTRRAAIDIAKACHVQALLDPLIDTALDPNDNTHIREQAAHAVVTFGSPASLPRLKPLALGRAGEDPDDTLKGHALTALWPKYITAKEVFSCLTPPKRTHLFRSYNAFLSDGLKKGLSDDDLLEALDWVQQISTMGSTSPVFSPDVSNKELEGRWQGAIADPLSPLELGTTRPRSSPSPFQRIRVFASALTPQPTPFWRTPRTLGGR